MTLLDDARRLLKDPLQSRGCTYCGAWAQQTGPYGYGGWCHLLTCPLYRTRVQKIIKVLEAAERVVSAWQADRGFHPIPGSPGGFSVEIDREIAYQREKTEAERALVDALKDEGP